MSLRQLARTLSVALGLLTAMVHTPLGAQDDKPAEMPAAAAKPKAKVDLTELLTPPKADDAKELLAFIRKVRDFESQDPKVLQEFAEKAPPVIKATCERILKIEKDPKSDAAKLAKLNLIALEAEDLYENDDAANRKAVFESAVKFLTGTGKPDAETAGLAYLIADILENATPREEAVTVLPNIAGFLTQSDVEEIKAKGVELQGLQRRLELPGHVMKLTGVTYGGKPFDVAKLKGKVVLVDFWATWCGFCVSEFPHMKELYRKYRDKGFEIVGVNLDENKDDLDAFMEKQKLPWTILYDEKAGGQHPAATEYGVTGLPTVMLIGADGKVITLDARGEALDEHLKNLLGSAKDSAAPALPETTDPSPMPPKK